MTWRASRRAVVSVGVTAALAGVAGCLSRSRDVERTVTERHATGVLRAVDVSTTIGDVEVVRSDADELAVEGQKAALSEDDLETIDLTTRSDGGVLELSVERDESRTLFGLRPDPAVDLSIAVPEPVAVRRITTATGDVGATDVMGDLTATTDTGDVSLDGIDGAVSTSTTSGAVEVADPESIDRLESETGDVTAALPGIDGDATIETGSGDVDLRVPDRLDMTLEITTETGNITVSDVEDLPEMAGDSLIEAVVGDGTHRLEVRTESGDVTVTGRK